MKLDYIQWNNLYYLCEKYNFPSYDDEHVELELRYIWQKADNARDNFMPYTTWLRYLTFNQDFTSISQRFPLGAARIQLYIDSIMTSQDLEQRGNISFSL